MRKFRAYLAACAVAVVAVASLVWWVVVRGSVDDVDAILAAYDINGQYSPLTISYPLPDTLFPPDIVAPTFRWKGRDGSDRWLVTISLPDESDRINALCDDAQWTPSDEQWETIRRRSVDEPARVTVLGVDSKDRDAILSAASVSIRTSQDPVGAPILYREVNLPFLDASKDTSRIRWRFGDIGSKTPPPIVLGNLPVCANCHSFSADGKVMGLDVDYANDKGSYAVLPVASEMDLDKDKIFSWSDYRREDGIKTLGMLSQVSPDGRYIISTAKDRSVFVPKGDLAFSQLFFPIKGILVVYDRVTKQFQPLPGADDPAYVQSNANWSPDGKWIVFARHTVYHLKYARDGNDDSVLLMPDECIDFLQGREQFLFDLYRIPFNDGKGGKAEPLAGASHNGMSNYFARFSPDGKWIIFCKAKTFMLLQPDSQLYIIPAEGGEARRLECNTSRMNSWHSWSPNGKWLVFSSKANTPYTQLFLTHIDEAGHSTPPVLLSHFTSPDRAANIPEFVNLPQGAIKTIRERFVDDHSYARTGLARARQGEHEMAVEAYRKALEINPDNKAIHEALGVSLLQLGKLDEAKTCFLEAILAFPTYVSARCNLGNVLVQLKQRDEALKVYREAVECDPKSAVARFLLGSLLFDLGTLDEAQTQLAEAVQLDPTHVEARFNLATLLTRQGHADQAVVHLRQILDQQAEFLPALLSLASLRASSNDPALRNGKEAVALAAKSCELTHSENAEALDILGMAYAETGQFAEAVSAAQSALRLTQTADDKTLEEAIQSRLRLYEQQRPFRRPATP